MNNAWDPRMMGQSAMGHGAPQPGGQVPMSHPSPGPYGRGLPQAQAPMGEMPDLTEEVSLNDDLEFEALSPLPEQGVNESARFAFMMFDAEGSLRLRSGRMFYGRVGEKRFPFLAPPDTHPLFPRLVDKWDMPKTRMGAIVLAYNVDKDGNFIPSDTFKYKLHALLFNDVQANWFRNSNKRRSFRTHDLMRTGTKQTQYGVEYSYSVEDQNVFSTLPPDKQQEILEKAAMLHQKYLGPRIGRPRPDSEIEDLLRDIDPTLRRQSGGAPAAPQGMMGGSPWAASPHAYVPQLGHPSHGQMGQSYLAGQPPSFGQPQGGYAAPQQPPHGFNTQHGPVSPNPGADFGQRLTAASHTMGGSPGAPMAGQAGTNSQSGDVFGSQPQVPPAE